LASSATQGNGNTLTLPAATMSVTTGFGPRVIVTVAGWSVVLATTTA